MEFAFILDPLASLKAYKDTSVAMMRALQDRGHALFALEQRDLFWDGKQTLGTVRLLTPQLTQAIKLLQLSNIELAAFIDSIERRSLPLVDGWAGFEAIRVVEAALESARTGAWIEIAEAGR